MAKRTPDITTKTLRKHEWRGDHANRVCEPSFQTAGRNLIQVRTLPKHGGARLFVNERGDMSEPQSMATMIDNVLQGTGFALQ